MVGFSAQMGENEQKTFETLMAHNAVMDREIAAHGGRVVKTIGDAYMVEFSSSVSAVTCGLNVQRTFQEMNQAAADTGKHIRVRIGIHVGDVVEHQNDLFGDAVNIAARLEPLAPIGGVCVSGEVYHQVRKKVSATGEDGGLTRLKNITEPVRTVYLQPADETLSAVLNEQSVAPSAPPRAAKRKIPKEWYGVAVVFITAIMSTAYLDGHFGISPTPTPLHSAGAMEAVRHEVPATPPEEIASQTSIGENSDGASPATTEPTTAPEELIDEDDARDVLRKARKSRRLETRMRLRAKLDEGRLPDEESLMTQGVFQVVGDAHAVQFRDAQGTVHDPGTTPIGQYDVWATWSEGDAPQSVGLTVQLEGGDIKTLRCSSGLQLCQAP